MQQQDEGTPKIRQLLEVPNFSINEDQDTALLDTLSMRENPLMKQNLSFTDQVMQAPDLLKTHSSPNNVPAEKKQFFTTHFTHKTHHKLSNASELLDTQHELPNYDTIRVTQSKKPSGSLGNEMFESAKTIFELMRLRDEYTFNDHQDYVNVDQFVRKDEITGEPLITWNRRVEMLPILKGSEVFLEDGVYFTKVNGETLVQVPTMVQFIRDLITLMDGVFSNSVASFCYKRIKYLEQKYKMHEIFNHHYEQEDQKQIKAKDFYNIFKVDTHIHHAAAMSAKHLLEFIRHKINHESETHVLRNADGSKVKLREIFQQINIKPHELSLDILDVQADKTMYKRFDRFNNKYNPIGQPKLREVFLKQDNYLKGRYLAELTLEIIKNLEQAKFVGCEWRVSIYGKAMEEWHKLGKWIVTYKLYSSRVRWMIQIPRLYAIYKKSGLISNFQDMIDNIFRPLFDITINPTIDPFLYQALFQVVGFDTVDDESLYENFHPSALKTTPRNWTEDKNPPYAYWTYYIYANLYSLNALRKERGLNTFKFRPHCGEAGDLDHLATAFLIADGINHGIELNKSPVLTYLYYLKQIGLAMSPVSNNKLFCRKFYEIGMNVTLSTDDPLILHLTNEPLIEEYAIASQVFDLSNLDLAEIARNSVRQSGFEDVIKQYWVGTDYQSRIQERNNEMINNLPNTRFQYRKITLNEEWDYLEHLIMEQNK